MRWGGGWGGWGGGWGGVGWDDNVHVPARTLARQPHHTRAGGGSLSLSLPGGPFWPLSSPNPPKRTSPASSAWLCSLLSLWWSVLAAQQPESFKTDLPSSPTGWGCGGVGGWGGWGGGWGGMITSMFLRAHWHGNLITRELAVGLCPFLSLVVRFGRSAAQILQNRPRQLRLLGRAPCSPSGGPFWPLSSPNPSKRTSPACYAGLCSLLSLWWSVLATQQPKSSKMDLASFVCLAVLLALPLSGGPFWPLSSPNPSKRTYPALPLGGGAVGWGVGWVGWGVGWDDNVHVPARTLARQPHHTRAGGGSLSLSLPGGPFWPLSSPNPPKRTSPAWSAWLSPLLSLWWSVLAAQQPKSSKTDLASLLCWAVLLALPLVVRFGRSAAQILQNGPRQLRLLGCFGRSAARILQNGPRQLAMLGCAPCSRSGGPFWPLSSPNPPKRTFPTTGGCAQPDSNPRSVG